MSEADRLNPGQVLQMDRAELKARSGRFEQLPWGLELAQLIQVGPESDPQPLHYGKRSPTFTGSGG